MTKLSTTPLRQVKTVQELIGNAHAQSNLQAVAASQVDPQRMMRLIANACRTTPKLRECDPMSLLGALMTCASIGIEPNSVLGHAYLIPFENRKKGVTEVQLVLGYKGMVDLARRSGHVVNIHADVVYEADEFSFEYGSNQHLKHIPAGERSKPIYAYCHAKLTDGEAFIVLPYAEGAQGSDASQGYKTAKKYGKKDSPWIAHEHQMARKTAVRALFNELPISVEKVTEALEIDGSKANFANFAMHPDQGSPETGETIEVEAIPADEEQAEAPETEPEKPTEDKAPEAKQAKNEASKEPAKEATEKDKPEEENEEFSGLVKLIASELSEAEDGGAVEAVLEIYSSQIAQTEGTPYHQQITEAADARREDLANG